MSIDYNQLKALVKEAMFTGGGINEPSAPEGIPHRMPAADTNTPVQDRGDPVANKLYETALAAREATEILVEALDDPTFDTAYEFAFKASALLRKTLNSLEETGAYPMPDQRVVAPPDSMQKYSQGAGGGDYGGGSMIGMGDGGFGGMQESDDLEAKLGVGNVTRGGLAKNAMQRARGISKGSSLQGIDSKEGAILQDMERLLTKIAEEGDLRRYKSELSTTMKRLLQRLEKDTVQDPGSTTEPGDI